VLGPHVSVKFRETRFAVRCRWTEGTLLPDRGYYAVCTCKLSPSTTRPIFWRL